MFHALLAKKILSVAFGLLMLITATGCATAQNQVAQTPAAVSSPQETEEVENCEQSEVLGEVAVIGDCNRPTVEIIGELDGECDSPPSSQSRCDIDLRFQNKTNMPIQYMGKVCAVIDGADYLSYYPEQDTGNVNPGQWGDVRFVMYGGTPGSTITAVYLGVSCNSSADGYKYIEGYGEFKVK